MFICSAVAWNKMCITGRKSAKTSVNGEDGRRRRMDVTVKLRKDKKDENLAKRRFVGIVAEKSISTGMDDADLDNSNLSGASEEISDFIGAQVYSVADIPTLCSILQKSDSDLSQIIETVRVSTDIL